jgi:hypothetical protein
MRLSRWQAQQLHREVNPMLGYLYRLYGRAEQRLDPKDPLRRAIIDAYNAVHALSVHLHYASCESGVGGANGGPAEPTDEPPSR